VEDSCSEDEADICVLPRTGGNESECEQIDENDLVSVEPANLQQESSDSAKKKVHPLKWKVIVLLMKEILEQPL